MVEITKIDEVVNNDAKVDSLAKQVEELTKQLQEKFKENNSTNPIQAPQNIHQEALEKQRIKDEINREVEKIGLETELLTKLRGDSINEYAYTFSTYLSKDSFDTFLSKIDSNTTPDFNIITKDFVDLFFTDKNNKIATETVNTLMPHNIATNVVSFLNEPKQFDLVARQKLLKDIMLELDRHSNFIKKNVSITDNLTSNDTEKNGELALIRAINKKMRG